ncbi:hypothetical protein CFP65_0063 [Kitasatospora sp. MMS16-BH015]|uniref:hypothetical protein n=1 Tax=Kitasatospora sp. MMS16-BH015 TaxID=2018025 RepID=UPI000CA29A55|nr:hypothetical protein [Kitasatospora sp. MMS16-BH015]AUG75049.1 hypothetical protein CFP65_0063 [Kitasatospora sp. MMS16-BH015]
MVNQDIVLRARMKQLSADGRVLRGTDGLWAYRILVQVNPEVYGSKLAHVLVQASHSVAHLPERQAALLTEAVAVARALEPANPYRAKVLARAEQALAALTPPRAS